MFWFRLIHPNLLFLAKHTMNRQLETYLTIFNQLDFEKIIDHPNILIAANFWDEDRFLAAKTCYKFMRAIDDLIDNYKSENQ